MNIKYLVLEALQLQGCKIEENTPGEGIITVTTPQGETWDFTEPCKVPSKRTEQLQAYDQFVKYEEEVK